MAPGAGFVELIWSNLHQLHQPLLQAGKGLQRLRRHPKPLRRQVVKRRLRANARNASLLPVLAGQIAAVIHVRRHQCQLD